MQNPRWLSSFGCVLKPEAGLFTKENLDFFILVDYRSLGSNVFMIAEMWWKQNHGKNNKI